MSNSQLVDSCLRVLQEKQQDIPQYMGQNDMEGASAYSVDLNYPTNGHLDSPSPSSHLGCMDGTLTHRGPASAQVAKLTRDIHQLSLDGHVPPQVEYVPAVGGYSSLSPRQSFSYEHMVPPPEQAYHIDPAVAHHMGPSVTHQLDPSVQHHMDPSMQHHIDPSVAPHHMDPSQHYVGYHDYEQYQYPGIPQYPLYSTGRYVEPEYSDRPTTPPSPSVKSDNSGIRWRDPNLTEVISFLSNPNSVVKANAAAYLQHLCYMDDPNKQKTRILGGIPPLVALLSNECLEVHRNACGALRNLSYGRQNDENKRAIKNAGGIPALVLLLVKSSDPEVRTLITGVLWNLSSCEDLKKNILDDGLNVLVEQIIIPHSGWSPTAGGDTCWSTVFHNSSGIIRNVSSAGEYARKKLRECVGLVDSMLYVIRLAIEKNNIGNKTVENCVCILRNLSYRCQEVEDPNYDKNPIATNSMKSSSHPKGENLGCFGASKKKRDCDAVLPKDSNPRLSQKNEPVMGMALLWQPDVVKCYLCLLQSCSNPETLEAAAGALQNLVACYWQPSIEIRAAVRKEKGLPILVELLRMEVDRVVCAVATALRYLAVDQRNKELIGKYAMRDLVQKIPSGNPLHDQGTSDDTIAAVLATLNEVIKKNAEFSRSLLEAGGVERLLNITKMRQKFTPRVLKFAGQVLFTMWQHQELREVYKKQGWKEQDFIIKTVSGRSTGTNSPSNTYSATLSRPVPSQKYEDRTVPLDQRSNTLPNLQSMKPGEPLYAQVNREKKKSYRNIAGEEGSAVGSDRWSYEDSTTSKGVVVDPNQVSGGDSWV